jgi:hypothetical protein
MLRHSRTSLWLVIVLIGVLGASSLTAGSGLQDQQTHGFRLQLVPTQNAQSPGEPQWKTGDVVRVLVMIINYSKRTVHFSLTNPWSDWETDLRDEAENAVPETEEFIELRERQKSNPVSDGRNILVALKPHEQSQDTVEISYRYKVKTPGKYFVQVLREFPEVSKEPVTSNRLEFTITP